MDQEFLPPHARPRVYQIAEYASERPESDVEKTEHGGPVAAAALHEVREIFNIVGTEDAVDGEFGAEGAEVSAREDERLGGDDDGEGIAEGGFDDDFAASGVEHFLFANLGFVSEACGSLGFHGFEAEFLLIVAAAAAVGTLGASGCFVCQ